LGNESTERGAFALAKQTPSQQESLTLPQTMRLTGGITYQEGALRIEGAKQ
jgi:hypothetical protein